MKAITRHINRLFLDPNNYRFIDKPEYKRVSDDMLTDPQIQKRTRFLLTGRNNEYIQDLIASFKENGFLPVNQIQVKELSGQTDDEKNYLVIEGNRRVATLKFLYEEWNEKKIDIGRLTESSFKSIPVILHSEETQKEHLIAVGLDLITGKRKWNPVNQAQLIEDLINKHYMTEVEICDSLGITKHALRRFRRSLALINRYKNSDYGDQFTSSMYSFFEEIITRTEIKEWLQWDDTNMCPTNASNEARIFSWLSTEEKIERDETGEEISRENIEPIITKALEIRELSKFINDPVALERMETSRSISEGFALSDAVGKTKFLNAVEKLKQDVATVFNFSEYMKQEHYDSIQPLRDKLDRILSGTKGNVSPYPGVAPLYRDSITGRCSEMMIQHYRKLQQLSVRHLNRINIFAGKNNSGKTTLLEAIYLLSQLNDLNAFIELERYRGKFAEQFNPKWLDKNFYEPIILSALFGELKISLSFTKEQTSELIDKSSYISSIIVDATVNSDTLTSTIHVFSNKETELYYQKSHILCHAAFTSPYRYNEGLLKRAHALAVRERFIDDIISFIREKIDISVNRIEMVNIEGENRFYVHTNAVEYSLDMTKYGEGVQRVFEIALLMGYCQNGILCIDEFEIAIHKRLLLDFSKFIHQLAERFNVQVFLTTHSKECIDAFIKNEYKHEDITAFALTEKDDGTIACKYVDGIRLSSLIESIDIDIRG